MRMGKDIGDYATGCSKETDCYNDERLQTFLTDRLCIIHRHKCTLKCQAKDVLCVLPSLKYSIPDVTAKNI